MDFFRRRTSGEPPAQPRKPTEPESVKSLNEKKSQELRALGEIYYITTTQGRQDTRALSRKLRDIQKIDQRLEELKAPPPKLAAAAEERSAGGPLCRCGAPYTPGDRYCCRCGLALPKPVKPMASCPACGRYLDHNAVFCNQCGSSMSARPLRVRHPITGQEASFDFQAAPERLQSPLEEAAAQTVDYDDEPVEDTQAVPSEKGREFLRHLERFARPAQVDSQPFVNRGHEYLDAQRWREAAAEFEAALLHNPRDGKAQYMLGVARYQNGEIEDAIDAFERCSRIDKQNSDCHNDLGLCYAKKGMRREALDHYLQALKLNSAHSDAHYNLAHLYLQQMAYSEALRHLQLYLQHSPRARDFQTVSNMIDQLKGGMVGPESFLPQR